MNKRELLLMHWRWSYLLKIEDDLQLQRWSEAVLLIKHGGALLEQEQIEAYLDEVRKSHLIFKRTEAALYPAHDAAAQLDQVSSCNRAAGNVWQGLLQGWRLLLAESRRCPAPTVDLWICIHDVHCTGPLWRAYRISQAHHNVKNSFRN